jgi:hypothetical protein
MEPRRSISLANRSRLRVHLYDDERMDYVEPAPLVDLLAVAQKVVGPGFAMPAGGSSEADALHRLAALPSAGWESAARRTLSKRGVLDPIWWLRLAEENQASAPSFTDTHELEQLARSVMSPDPGGPRRRTRSRSAWRSWRKSDLATNDLGPKHRVCVACGLVRGLEELCDCQGTENAGRFDN